MKSLLSFQNAQRPKDYLIIGLGNPGSSYEKTRHNAGRIVVELIQKKISAKGGPASGWKFLTPDTFMNNSGKAVAMFVKSKKDLKKQIALAG